MEERTVLQCISDHRQELGQYDSDEFVVREECGLIDLNSKLAQVVTGVRRSGKSTLCHIALQKKGVQYGYVNFDDDRLSTLTVDDLNTVLTCIYRIYGTDIKYLFFDEIQNVDGWHLFVNRLLRQGHRIVITGSNAKLLSSNLTTHLAGRFNEIKLYPFSFKEYCLQRKIDTEDYSTRVTATLKNALEGYLIEGGFPELPYINNKSSYIDSLVNTIVNKDIRLRYHIRNAEGIKTLANHLINNFAQLIDVVQLDMDLKIGSEKTIRNYIDHLAQAYMILPLSKFSYKSRIRLRNDKFYIVDNGLATYHAKNLSSINYGWRLENAVYVELLRRTSPKMYEIYYYRETTRSPEVDFAVTHRGAVVELIQVSYYVDNPKTLKREINALVEAAKKTSCNLLTLVTMDKTERITQGDFTINIVSALDWLLDRS